ncbi:hypothetical protein TGMAS_309390 [Toxoplasma gondii MAS]|uniref:Uncharacterized protein n=1 Tax=Toxoplasma gondii MAS TaxID=943118 RepID=A0A086QK29_TOXGO|nr:hypothetical protein TGMAS_309390 [Toxoplasma gondii MAS]
MRIFQTESFLLLLRLSPIFFREGWNFAYSEICSLLSMASRVADTAGRKGLARPCFSLRFSAHPFPLSSYPLSSPQVFPPSHCMRGAPSSADASHSKTDERASARASLRPPSSSSSSSLSYSSVFSTSLSTASVQMSPHAFASLSVEVSSECGVPFSSVRTPLFGVDQRCKENQTRQKKRLEMHLSVVPRSGSSRGFASHWMCGVCTPRLDSWRSGCEPRCRFLGSSSSLSAKEEEVSSVSSSSASSSSSAPSDRFRSAVHREMIVAMTRTHLQNLLLKRFGTFKTQECRILASPAFSAVVLKAWASAVVDANLRLDGEGAMRLAYAPPPPAVLSDPKVKELVASDPEAAWMLKKLSCQSVASFASSLPREEEALEEVVRVKQKDNVPQPHFPSVLKMDHPQFPYEPHELEKMRDLYGVLLKWPYREQGQVASVAARRASLESKREERLRKGEVTEEATQEDETEVAGQLKVTTGCSDSYVYAPSEMETGLYREH